MRRSRGAGGERLEQSGASSVSVRVGTKSTRGAPRRLGAVDSGARVAKHWDGSSQGVEMSGSAPLPPRDNSRVRVPPPLLYFAAIAVGYWLRRRYALPFVPAPLAQPVGDALVVLAVGLALSGVVTFRRAGTSANPINPSTTVVMHG